MPSFEVTGLRDQDIMELLKAEKAKHPERNCYQPPSFLDTAGTITAVQAYRLVEGYVEEEVAVEATTCSAKKNLGGTCGRKLPCRYHK